MESARTGWNRPERDGISHNGIKSARMGWNQPEWDGISQNEAGEVSQGAAAVTSQGGAGALHVKNVKKS
eukprot:530064-Prymnesium_polylepis.1